MALVMLDENPDMPCKDDGVLRLITMNPDDMCNALVPLWHHAAASHVPAAKFIAVRIGKLSDESL